MKYSFKRASASLECPRDLVNSCSAFRLSVVIYAYCNINIFKIFKVMIIFNSKTGIFSDVES